MNDFFVKVEKETDKAVKTHGDYHSLHEGYAILLEEVDELWDIVRMKKKNRKLDSINKELIQIASCAYKLHMIVNAEPNRFVN